MTTQDPVPLLDARGLNIVTTAPGLQGRARLRAAAGWPDTVRKWRYAAADCWHAVDDPVHGIIVALRNAISGLCALLTACAIWTVFRPLRIAITAALAAVMVLIIVLR